MYLVDKQNVVGLQIGEDGQIACLRNTGPDVAKPTPSSCQQLRHRCFETRRPF